MKTSGYVRLYRKSQNNPIWTELAPAVFKVACYCIMNAEWKGTVWYDGTAEVPVPVGALVRSYRDIASDCRLTLQQVWKAFKHLDQLQITSRGTLKAPGRQHEVAIIQVRNYLEYQPVMDVSESASNGVDNAKENTTRTRRITRREREAVKTASKTSKLQETNGTGLLFEPVLKEEDLKNNQPEDKDISNDAKPSWFDQWWAIYWKPVDKKPAREIFNRVVKTEELFQTVMEATRAQYPERKTRPYDKQEHPTTWLNKERWNNPAPPTSGTSVAGSVARPVTFSEAKQSRQEEIFTKLVVYDLENRQ